MKIMRVALGGVLWIAEAVTLLRARNLDSFRLGFDSI